MSQSRALRLIAEQGVAVMRPQQVAGKWRGALVGKRKQAVIRKEAVLNGTVGTFDPATGGWLEEWDETRNYHPLRAQKTHKRVRDRDVRVQKVDKGLADMDERIRKYRQEMNALKPVPGIVTLIKRLGKK